jgi:hypothetical protein
MRTLLQENNSLKESLERFELANLATLNILWDWDLLTDEFCGIKIFNRSLVIIPDEIEPDIESWMMRVHHCSVKIF